MNSSYSDPIWSPSPADLEIRVTTKGDGDLLGLDYVLHSPNGRFDLSYAPFSGGRLHRSEFWQRKIFKTLEKLHRRKDSRGDSLVAADAAAELALLGEELAEQLFPRELRRALEDVQEAKAVLLFSDDPWIPWEIVKPYDTSRREANEAFWDDGFMGSRFQLTRWFAGDTTPAIHVEVNRIAVVEAGSPSDLRRLENAVAELHFLIDLAARHKIDERSLTDATYERVLAHLLQYDLTLIHFVGHGEYDDENSETSGIHLLDGRTFRPRDVRQDLRKRLRANSPFVFLNACQAGRQGWAMTRPGGWARRLVVDSGCRGFVAPQWTVNDASAYTFAKSFYEALERGETLGSASLEARRALPEDPLGRLAYAIYAHPNVQLRFDRVGHGRPKNNPRSNVHTISNAPSLPALFLGRGRDLAVLKESFGVGKSTSETTKFGKVIVIRGWPGVGKTSVAVALAHEKDLLIKYSGGILWASLGEAPDLLSELVAWGRLFDSAALVRATHVREASSILRNLLAEGRYLLVLDDIWNVDHAAPFIDACGSKCAILITTREPGLAHRLVNHSDHVYHLPVLDVGAAIELLAALAPEATRQSPELCRRLVEDLERLPLALQVAGRLLRLESSMEWGIEELIEELRRGKAVLEAPAPIDMIDARSGRIPSVEILLERSTARLDEVARKRFWLLGGFAAKPATFDVEALRLVWQVDDPRPTLRVFAERGLVEPVGGGRFQIHMLLAAHAENMDYP